MDLLKIKERLQVGDTMLFRFDCPRCHSEEMAAYPFGGLDCCGLDVTDWEINIKHARLLVGTRRPGRISKKTVQALKDIYGPYCTYCQSNCEIEYHIDHIVPLSAGGSNLLDNLCISCAPCNLTAGAKVFSGPVAKRRYILKQRGIVEGKYDWGTDDRLLKCYGLK